MAIVFHTYQKQFSLAAGLVDLKITYAADEYQYLTLDFDVINIAELSHGYEDDDQLTFYPNVLKLTFDDYKKQNYDVLKLSVGSYAATLPENRTQFGGVTVKLNGAVKFKGWIDELTLEYDEDELTCKFEVVDYTLELRNMNVDRNIIINPDGSRLPDNHIATLLTWLYGVYKQICPDIPHWAYNYDLINLPGLYGFFIKHDWEFKGNSVVSTCQGQRHLWNGMPTDPYPIPNLGNPMGWNAYRQGNNIWWWLSHYPILFNFDSTNMFGENRPCRTWTDYLRLVALQFGAIIGVMDYGKVYFIKRFGNYNLNPIDISGQIIENNFNKKIHLPVLRGVIINNNWNGIRTYEYGNIEKTSNNEPKYENRIKRLDTNIGSYIDSGGSGTCVYTNIYYPPCNYPPYSPNYIIGCWNVRDPQINQSGQMFQLIGKWQRENRVAPKDQVEVDLWGLDYDMVSVYRITPPNTGNLAVNFRPMRMTKSLVNNRTHIVGVEV